MAIWRHDTRTPINRWGPLPPHATPPRRRDPLRMLERLLLVAGIVCIGYYTYVSAETALYQAYETRELNAILASGPEGPPEARPATAGVTRRRPPERGEAVGRIEIPRLSVSAVVRAGSDARTLRLAVGHIPGTA